MGTPTPYEVRRAARNARWAELRTRGIPWRRIAAREGVSLSTVQRGVAEHEQRAVDVTTTAAQAIVADEAVEVPERPADIDAERLFMHVVAAHVQAMDDLCVLAQAAGHDGAKVGAVRTRLQAARSLAELLAMVGLLPDPARVLVLHAERQKARQAAKRTGEALLTGARRDGRDVRAPGRGGLRQAGGRHAAADAPRDRRA